MSKTYFRLANGDFVQDWSNAGLLTTADNWDSIPGIVGFRGDGLTSSTGADPRNVTGTSDVVDVEINRTAPDTYTTGGVAEFQLSNPTIALTGSGTADAPYIALYLDASERQDVKLSFVARDLDASTDDAVQSIAVQYRIGDSGTWSNVPGGYAADVTTKGTATQTTNFELTLPPAVNGQADVQVRIITTNAGGNDEWVGIDDIRVTSAGTGGQVVGFDASSVDVSHDEGNAGVTPYTFTVERSGGTEGDVTFSGTFASASTDAADFGGVKPVSFTGTIPAGATSTTVTVNVAGDAASEANETFSLTLSTVANSAAVATTIGTATATGTIVNDDVSITKISAIQGAGEASGMVGQTVTIDAIVVGDFQNGDADNARNLGGFYVQEEAFDSDGNPLTSEGLFIYGGSGDVHVGDRVRVTGKISEYYGLTELTATSISVVEAGAVADVNAMAATIDLPAAGTSVSQDGDYQPDLEAYEGMLVTIPETLTVTEQYNLDRFNEMKLVAGDRPETFTQIHDPDAAAYQDYLEDLGARTITYDDGLNGQNAPINNVGGLDPDDNPATAPNYATDNAPRMGDTVTGLTGVLDYQWAGNSASGATWRIRSIESDDNTFESVNERTEAPEDVGGRLKVASFNVLNYFKTLDNGASTAIGEDPRGAEDTTEFARQTEKLVAAIVAMGADVLALVELENDFRPGSSGNALEFLVAQLNDVLGAGTYAWVNPGQQFVGGDAIAVGFIYKTATVAITADTTVEILNDADLPALGLDEMSAQSTVGHVFDGENTSRNALAVSFTEIATGESFTAVANHLKSKSGTGTGADADHGDGQGNWQNQRELAAEALTKWAATDPTGSGDHDVLLLGDFNAYAKEDAIKIIESAGYENLGVGNGEYSYVFDGQTGTLDDVFANDSMAGQVTGTTHWHVNSDEADALDYNTNYGRDQSIFDGDSPVRTSDHDPLIIGLNLGPETPMTYKLQLLHFSDAEAGLLASDTAKNLAALVDAFEDDYANTLILSGGDNYIPGPFMAASTDSSVGAATGLGTNPGNADMKILNTIGVEASTVGNHEFDLGTNAFADNVADANFVYLTSNLNFSGDSALSGKYVETVGDADLETAASLAKKIAPSAVIEKGGEKIGLVGATTQILESISSTGNVEVKGFAGDGSETNDMALLAAQLQIVIDDLISQGVNKIILMSHLQNLALEKALAPLLTGVDIILAAGSHTRLGDADDEPVAFDGHDANFADTYPIVTAGADGKTTLIVNTDGEYTYLGRLVVDFDENGEIVLDNLAATTDVNGAYAATEENVAEAWGDTDGDLSDTAFAEGTKGETVADVTEAVEAVINAKDGIVYGYTNVYLEGDRTFSRFQETNLGDLSADANRAAADDALAGQPFIVSLKNGGGIRAQIGAVNGNDGGAEKVPPLANPEAGKPAGGISQLDIENALRFDNKLMVFDTTAQGLLNILNSPNATTAGNGGYMQLGGVRVSYDPDLPAGQRIVNVALVDDEGKVIARVVENGVVVADAPALISIVTLNFTANGGDGYLTKQNGENFRFLLADGTLSAPVDEALDFTAAANVPADALGEQKAFMDYVQENYGTPETAYDGADTSASEDVRIENLNVRADGVFQGETVDGTDSDDVIVGSAVADTLSGGDGDDEISGLAGDDVLNGGDGDDIIRGGDGNDVIAGGAGDNELFGDAGDDVFVSGENDETIDGGEGVDTVDYSANADGVTADLSLGEAFGDETGSDALAGIENLTGGSGDDTLIGDAGANVLVGNAGDDVLMGGGGADRLVGGEGADDLVGGAGDDTIVAGAGDTVVAGAGNDLILVSAEDGAPASVDGGDDDDTVRLTGTGTGALGATVGVEMLDVASGTWAVAGSAGYQAIEIHDGATVTSKISLDGSDRLTVAEGGALAVGNGDRAVEISGAVDGLVIDNAGTISALGDGTYPEGIYAKFGSASHTLTIVNRESGVISAGDKAIQLESSSGSAGTVVIDNAGLIESEDGHTVDLRKLYSTSVTVFNREGGQILGADNGFDALRPAFKGSTTTQVAVYNDGLIRGSDDGIDFQEGSGTLYNGATGLIESTANNAVSGDKSIVAHNAAGGVIRGLNGSGINLDTEASDPATEVYNDGLISGNYDGSGDGDGDGVDVDGLVMIENRGRIEANGADNLDDFADGIAAGGGSIANLAGGEIYGETNGILIDNSDGGAAFAATTITNAGSITATLGVGVKLVGIHNDVLVNSGTIASASGVAVDMGDGDDTVTNTGTITGAILLGAGKDTFTGGASAETVDGGDGDDAIDGGDGNDVIIGGAGNDVLKGGAGDDVIRVGAGNDTVDGGAGFDTLDLSDATGAISLDTAAGKVSGAGIGSDTFTSIEAFRFGAGNDVVTGGNGDEIFDGGAGNDTLKGGAGDDQLAGGDGNDTVDGGSSDDVVAGGAGDDTLKGGSGDDTVDGGDGVDNIDGGSGDDIVTAGAGNDIVAGGSGGDVITGGVGNDVITGGSGHDVFVFAAGFGKDIIKDFGLTGSSSDVIEFSSDLFDDFAEVMSHATQSGADVLITVDADTTLTLANIKLAALATDDFRFA
ncbi:ExeM/NucH family extracellular endonuclease [Xanthobacteraceae bacterium Astr-EGSB]|uniref:ExeM/NucH family extracellular endonuclease n=1 Tax=Astrobacterium formosum TaxID=3069710 RepID=UPI0027AEE2C6|nr:ExeM/NucH family extracellular endonuclease [Xanthobacteraceae bacterium Astr-EGSB]